MSTFSTVMLKQLQEIQTTILRRYTSLSSPDFSFVMESIQDDPYAGIVQQFKSIFKVREQTDPNYDVCFVYELEAENRYWSVQISMVGPYAIVLRVYNPGDAPVLITNNTKDLSNFEQSIFAILDEHQLQVVNRDLLLVPLPMQLFATEPENTCVYQALFSDEDIIPWK